MRIEGLTDFQNDLLNVEKNAEKVFKKAMQTSGNKLVREVRKKGKALVTKRDNVYHKKFKRGKVFIDPEGDITVRALNTAPHAHLLEYGHRQVINPPKDGETYVTKIGGEDFKTLNKVEEGKGIGQQVGFIRGRKVMEKGAKEFEQKREDIQEISKALDKLLMDNKL